MGRDGPGYGILVVDDQGPWIQGRNWKIIEQPELEKEAEEEVSLMQRAGCRCGSVRVM